MGGLTTMRGAKATIMAGLGIALAAPVCAAAQSAAEAGPGPQSEIASADELPEAVRERWAGSPAHCSDFFEMPPPSIGFSVPIRTGTLYALVCGIPGAYNAYFEFFMVVGDTVYPVQVPGMIDEGPIVEYGAWNVTYDEETQGFETFFKGRGIGDCGVWSRYGWTEGAAQASGFVLLEQRAKGECDGERVELEDWPRTWPRD